MTSSERNKLGRAIEIVNVPNFSGGNSNNISCGVKVYFITPFLRKKEPKKNFFPSLIFTKKTLKISQNLRASALPNFKKETIGGKPLKNCLKIGICDNL